jgi:hypothetical protein
MSSLPLTKELRQFLKPYHPDVVAVAAAARSLVFAEAPSATELVYDAYNAVAMGYSFTGRPGDAFCHIAVYSQWVNLGFNRGAELPDPDGLLVGSGRLIRHLRVQSLSDLGRPFIRGFVRAAIAAAKGRSESVSAGVEIPKSVVRAVYPKRRRPRPAPAAR